MQGAPRGKGALERELSSCLPLLPGENLFTFAGELRGQAAKMWLLETQKRDAGSQK